MNIAKVYIKNMLDIIKNTGCLYLAQNRAFH